MREDTIELGRELVAKKPTISRAMNPAKRFFLVLFGGLLCAGVFRAEQFRQIWWSELRKRIAIEEVNTYLDGKTFETKGKDALVSSDYKLALYTVSQKLESCTFTLGTIGDMVKP